MSLTVSEGASGTYTPPEAGTFTARCIGLIDLGTQTTTYEGETKSAHKLLVQFELTDADNRRDDGSAHILSKRFTASLHPKAALRGFLEAWRGRPFAPEELRGFDLKTLLGVPCLLGIVHSTKDGGARTFANISSCMRLPKGMAAPEGALPLVHFDLANPNWATYEVLPERIRAQIDASPEFASAAAHRPQRVSIPPPAAQALATGAAGSGFDDMDNDIPF